MQFTVDAGGDVALGLRHVMLVYADPRGGKHYVTLHEPEVPEGGGAPVLGPGRPLGTAFLKSLAGDLGQRLAPEVLPTHVLARTPDVTVWWRPPSLAPLFYSGSATGLEHASGRLVPHPALVFRATDRGLWVRALDVAERPTASTLLRAAPYYNVGKTGSVCLGTMRRPNTRRLDALERWETAFFESEFTHVLPGVTPTAEAEGFATLWTTLADLTQHYAEIGAPAPAFPVDALAPAPRNQTLAQFIDAEQGGDW